jgi:hypothetical protein
VSSSETESTAALQNCMALVPMTMVSDMFEGRTVEIQPAIDRHKAVTYWCYLPNPHIAPTEHMFHQTEAE